MAAHRLLDLAALLDDQVGDGDHVPQLAQFAVGLGLVVKFLGLLPENFQPVHGALEREVRPHDAHVVGHDRLHLALRLDDHQHLLGVLRAFEIPVGNALLKIDFLQQRRRVARGLVGVDHRFDQRVRGQAVGAVQSRARGLAQRVEPFHGGFAVGVDLHAAAAVVRRRGHGNPVFGDVDADRAAFLVDVREMALHGLGVLVRHVEVDEVGTPFGHLAVEGAGHHVARREGFHRVVFVHELLAVGQPQDGPEAAHGFGDQEVGLLAGVVERRGVELDEFHVLGHRLGAVAHGDAVARGDHGVRGRGVDVAAAARGHDGEFRKHGLDLVGVEIQDVGPERGQSARVARDEFAQMVLRQQVDGEVAFENRDVRMLPHRLHERPFDLGSREVLVVEDAVLRVSAFAVELETPVGGLVETRAPGYEVGDQFRGPPHDQFHGLLVAFACAADQRVADVFLECVGGVRYRADAALCIIGVALFDRALGDDRNVSVGCGFQRERKARGAGTDNQKVGFHGFFLFLLPCSAAKLQKIVTLPHNFGQNMERHIDISRFDYDLPDERIAKFPLAERSASKLLVWRGGEIAEKRFADIGDVLPAGELLVFNNTKVIRARIVMHKLSGARIEVFCLEPHDPADYERAFAVTGGCTWSCIVGNRKKWKEGYVEINFERGGCAEHLRAWIVEDHGRECVVRFEWTAPMTFGQLLEYLGRIPIPPYLNRESEEIDNTRYQTVYSKFEGSVAAPTAGLHFTPELIGEMKARGFAFEEVTLHVGAGTFLPVKDEDAARHPMHTEHFEVRRATVARLLEKWGHITAVGTTSVRTLESLAALAWRIRTAGTPDAGRVVGQWELYDIPAEFSGREALQELSGYMEREGLDRLKASTQIMITPLDYEFRIVHNIVTNFHQPKSTLLLLVSAFVGDGWRRIYDYALGHGFRFLSYGDSSVLLRE